jgi:hypothetical protein
VAQHEEVRDGAVAGAAVTFRSSLTRSVFAPHSLETGKKSSSYCEFQPADNLLGDRWNVNIQMK